jgi:cytochrome c-type biogenesis protein CcmH/NrfG
LLIYRRLLILLQLRQFSAAATSALIRTWIYRCYCSSFIAVSAGSLNALVMWQQWTFSVMHLHHQHHHHHHHHCVNEKTTQRQLARLLQTIAEKAVHIFQ